LLLLLAFALAAVGCSGTPADVPFLTVTASDPGANARVVAQTVAAPLEQELITVEDMLYMESQSNNDGSYTLTVAFKPRVDLHVAQVVVQNRVALALRLLPDAVKRTDVAVRQGAAEEKDPTSVVIALLDRGDHGREALREWSKAVAGRLTEDGVLEKAEVFPGPDEKQTRLVRIDRASCARLGVAEADVQKTVRAAGPAVKVEALKQRTVTSAGGEKVPLGAVAVFEEVTGPAAVYRVNLYPAVRISGSLPEGKTRARAVRRCLELAEDERKKGNHPEGFVAVHLIGR
jgi:multidrug efflux pump subunit AcrB